MATTAAASPALGINLYDESASYVHGANDVPLIGATISDMFDRVVEQLPEHEALVSRHYNNHGVEVGAGMTESSTWM